MTAARAGKRALALCTVSNSILTGEEMPVEERESALNEMIETALNTAVAIAKK
jgi:purine-nucleoside phosphorylase